MKTIATAEMMNSFRNAERLLAVEQSFNRYSRSQAALAQARRVRGTGRGATGSASLYKTWMKARRIGIGEKLMLLALTGGAVAGLGFAFSSLLDLVQHWALFQTGIQTLVQ